MSWKRTWSIARKPFSVGGSNLTFQAIETQFTPHFSKRNRLDCRTQAGYYFRKVNQLLEITLDQRADKFCCTDAVLLVQNLYFVLELLWNFDGRAMWFWAFPKTT